MDEIIEQLYKLASDQGLKKRTIASFHDCLDKNSELRDELGTDKYILEFWCHRLSFEHQMLMIPVIETKYVIVHEEIELGYYSLITELSGEDNDDIFVIHD